MKLMEQHKASPKTAREVRLCIRCRFKNRSDPDEPPCGALTEAKSLKDARLDCDGDLWKETRK